MIKGFDSAGITEAVNNAKSVYEKIENSFRSQWTLFFNKEKKRVVYWIYIVFSFFFFFFTVSIWQPLRLDVTRQPYMYVPYLQGIKTIKTSQNIEFYFWTKFSSDKIFHWTKFWSDKIFVTSEKFRHFCPIRYFLKFSKIKFMWQKTLYSCLHDWRGE